MSAFCISCGHSLPDGASFCPACGTKVEIPRCPSCGAEIDFAAAFCMHCGHRLQAPDPQPEPVTPTAPEADLPQVQELQNSPSAENQPSIVLPAVDPIQTSTAEPEPPTAPKPAPTFTWSYTKRTGRWTHRNFTTTATFEEDTSQTPIVHIHESNQGSLLSIDVIQKEHAIPLSDISEITVGPATSFLYSSCFFLLWSFLIVACFSPHVHADLLTILCVIVVSALLSFSFSFQLFHQQITISSKGGKEVKLDAHRKDKNTLLLFQNSIAMRAPNATPIHSSLDFSCRLTLAIIIAGICTYALFSYAFPPSTSTPPTGDPYGVSQSQSGNVVSQEIPWKDTYASLLSVYAASYPEDEYYCAYTLYDIDRNGVPELFVDFGTCEADYEYQIYSILSDNTISLLGTFGSSRTSVCGLGAKNTFLLWSIRFYEECDEYISLVTLENGQLVKQTIFSESVSVPHNLTSLDFFPVHDRSGLNWTGNPEENNQSILDNYEYIPNDYFDPLEYFINNCDSEYFYSGDVATFDADMTLIARNAIYAHSGRIFQKEKWSSYFSQYDWYYPYIEGSDFSESMLNEYQVHNLDLLLDYETEMGYR